MLIYVAEMYNPNQEKYDTRIETSVGFENEDFMKDSLELRKKCMIEWGWMPQDLKSDIDVYDEMGESRTVGLYVKDIGRLGVSMRATQFEQPSESLSVGMLKSNAKMQDEVVQGLYNMPRPQAGSRYDITRLVTDREVRNKGVRSLMQVVEVFGAMQGYLEGEDNQWFYLTTLPLLNALNRVGIEAEVMSSGKVSAHDDEESYFCAIDPTEIVNNTAKHTRTKITHRFLSKGIEHAHRDLALKNVD